jgi:hypothetical protein
MGGEQKKLTRDVVARWNLSFYMHERLIEENVCLSSSEFEINI